MHIPYNKKNRPNATQLRKNMTEQETQLWYKFLKTYPVKVNRQKMLDNFIVDFYCHKARLVIELDGSQHYVDNGVEHDRERTAILNAWGLKVIRYSNYEIDNNFDSVCEDIHNKIKGNLRDNEE